MNAILESQDTPGEMQTRECRLAAGSQNQAFDFSVRAKTLEVSPDTCDTDFLGDPRRLTRVLGNMVKNALEAESRGSTVTMGAVRSGETVEFWVHNPGVMAEEARLQVFQRSFSTKGRGRGIGTYSIRLLGETCLKGKVGFTSEEGAGTRFYIRLPLGI